MIVARIADLPFQERPLLDLLNLVDARAEPDADYAGYGWAHASRVWLVDDEAPPRLLDDALVLALHCPDDGELLVEDIELYFELPEQPPVTVLASAFLASWLPRLPREASAIVLALCNPHRAFLTQPRETSLPFHFAQGDVVSWIGHDDRRIELRAPAWCSPNAVRDERGMVSP